VPLCHERAPVPGEARRRKLLPSFVVEGQICGGVVEDAPGPVRDLRWIWPTSASLGSRAPLGSGLHTVEVVPALRVREDFIVFGPH